MEKVHGKAVPGEAMGRNLDFFTFTSPVNILATGTANATADSQKALDKLVEVISLGGQPVILGTPYENGGNYSVKFAVEHSGSWTADTLETAVLAHAKVPFAAANAATITVTLANQI